MKSLTHEYVRRMIGEGMNIERNSAACAAIRTHLDSCAECRAYLQSLNRTIECYQSYDVKLSDKAKRSLDSVLDTLKQSKS